MASTTEPRPPLPWKECGKTGLSIGDHIMSRKNAPGKLTGLAAVLGLTPNQEKALMAYGHLMACLKLLDELPRSQLMCGHEPGKIEGSLRCSEGYQWLGGQIQHYLDSAVVTQATANLRVQGVRRGH
jgi:hypothetical protein